MGFMQQLGLVPPPPRGQRSSRMNTMAEILHYFGMLCLLASLLIRILPPPEEIAWKPYSVFHGIVRRASLNLPANSPNGNPDANPTK